MCARIPQPALSPVVGIGASAGGVEPLLTIVRELPGDFPALVLITLHLAHSNAETLPSLLDRASELRVEPVVDGTVPERGTVYVARPDEHLTLEHGTLRSTHGPREHGHRPAIDLMLRSIAQERGAGAVGVILSGTLDDGSRGAASIKAAGGTVYVQDESEARYPSMVRSTLRLVDVDAALPVSELTRRLVATAAGVAGARAVGETGARDVNDHPPEPR